MKKIPYILFFILLITANCWAVPSVSSVTGTLSDGQTITISGSGFTSKATAGPLVASFDSATSAANFSTGGSVGGDWGLGYDAAVASASARTTNAPYYINCSYTNPDYDTLNAEPSTTYTTFYISFYTYVTESTFCVSTGSQNSKFLRWYTDDSPICSIQETYYAPEVQGVCGAGYYEVDSILSSKDGGFGSAADWTDSLAYCPYQQWNQVQAVLYCGTSGNTDASMRMYYNGALRKTWTGFGMIDGTYGHDRNALRIGKVSGSNYSGGSIYISEAYIDSTPAHVFISDASNITDWATHTTANHQEIQVASTWTDTEITATLNLGSFAGTETVYLYVVDVNEDTSNPYEIDLSGGTPDTTAPTLSSVTINGTSGTFAFDEAVDITTWGTWTATGSTTGSMAVAYASGDGTSSIGVTVSPTAVYGETITITSTGTDINDASSNQFVDVTDMAVTNSTSAPASPTAGTMSGFGTGVSAASDFGTGVGTITFGE